MPEAPPSRSLPKTIFNSKDVFLLVKRLLSLLLALCLCCAPALAEIERGPYYDQVFDTSDDGGLLTVRFIWLGPQVADDKPGDCMILTSPEGKIMVLDAGHPLAEEYVISALDAMGVTRIDYLVASHPHIDHIGCFPALAEHYEIGTLYTSDLRYESSRYYRAYVEAFQQRGTPHIILAEGDTFNFGDSVIVQVFNPPATIEYPEDYPRGSTQFINNQSLALKFTYGDAALMLAGDLYSGGERSVVERWGDALDCDVMKANHHGANTSSSSVWRNAVSPKITVITSDTIEDLSIARKYTKNDQQMYHTFLDGCIRLHATEEGEYAVLTEKERTTTLFD